MNYVTKHIENVITKREAFDQEAIPVKAYYAELSVVHAHHRKSGEVFQLDYLTAKGFIDTNDNLLYDFDEEVLVRSVEVKPRAEHEKFVNQYYKSIRKDLDDRTTFIKELVNSL